MKNQESFHGGQEKESDVALTDEQRANNPNGFWEHFFEQSREHLLKIFEGNPDPDGGAAKEIIKDAFRGLPKNKKEFTSEEEIYRRGLEYYREKHQGFGDAKGLEKKYKNFRENERNRFIKQVVAEMKEVEYDEASGPIEGAVAKLLEKEPDISHEEVVEFRNQLWERFTAEKGSE